MAKAVRTKITETRNTEALLARMPLELRGKQLNRALRAAGNVVAKEAKRRVSPPGYPGDDPSKPPLRDSIKVVVKEYTGSVMSITGGRWPQGAHAHLVEFGHGGPSPAPPHPFLRPAADHTKQAQTKAMTTTLRKGLRELAD